MVEVTQKLLDDLDRKFVALSNLVSAKACACVTEKT